MTEADSKTVHLDVKGLKCPLPILKAKKMLANLEQDTLLVVDATDAGAPGDFEAFCRHTGHGFVSLLETHEANQTVYTITIKRK